MEVFGLCSQNWRKKVHPCGSYSDCLMDSITTSPVLCQQNKTLFKSVKLKAPERNYWSNSSFPEVLTSSMLWQELSVYSQEKVQEPDWGAQFRWVIWKVFLITWAVWGICTCSCKQQGISYTSHLAGAVWILVRGKPSWLMFSPAIIVVLKTHFEGFLTLYYWLY